MTESTIRWYTPDEKLPDDFVSVMGHIINTDPPLGVHECYKVKDVFYFPLRRMTHEIDRWAYFPDQSNRE